VAYGHIAATTSVQAAYDLAVIGPVDRRGRRHYDPATRSGRLCHFPGENFSGCTVMPQMEPPAIHRTSI